MKRLFDFTCSFMAFIFLGYSGDIIPITAWMIRQELGWKPPFTMDEGLRETAAWFRGKL